MKQDDYVSLEFCEHILKLDIFKLELHGRITENYLVNLRGIQDFSPVEFGGKFYGVGV